MKSQIKFEIGKNLTIGMVVVGLTASQFTFGSEGGTNSGHSDRATSTFQGWCRDANAELEDAQIDAKLAIANGNLPDAKRILINGLAEALREKAEGLEPIDQAQSLTFRVLSRGLEIESAMDDVGLDQPMALNEQVKILLSYYEFAKRTSRDLDQPFYIPIRAPQGRVVIDQRAFEARYEQYARDQISWLLNSFIEDYSNTRTGDIGIKTVRGSDAVFFKVAELITSYAASDLQDSLFGPRYACVSEKLTRLQIRLSKYNTGDVSALGGPRLGLNAVVYPKLTEYLNQIQTGCGTR